MDGVVLEAGPASGFGLAVYIQHENGDVTVYGHMDQILVPDGQVVKAGDVIALLGNRGQATGPHLHFEVHVGGSKAADRSSPVAARARHGHRSVEDTPLDAPGRTLRQGASAVGDTVAGARREAGHGTRPRPRPGHRGGRAPRSSRRRPRHDAGGAGGRGRRCGPVRLARPAGRRRAHGHRRRGPGPGAGRREPGAAPARDGGRSAGSGWRSSPPSPTACSCSRRGVRARRGDPADRPSRPRSSPA